MVAVADLYFSKEDFIETSGMQKDAQKTDIYLGSIQIEGVTPHQ